MEQASEKRDKTKKSKSPTISDSSYGSMITGSSSSSLSLSLFSESDLAEVPSTSGCSSEMATAMRIKEKKKERAKEFMKKLKSMLPNKEHVGKMDTLSTLEQLVDSMRQFSENDKKNSESKTPFSHDTGSYHSADTEKLSQSNMYITVSTKNHVVQTASVPLMEHLGYPADWWKGRLLKDFLKKKDINTVNGCLVQHSADDDCGDISESFANSSSARASKEGSKYFYARIRRFRKLGEGFNLQNVVSYCPFCMMVSSKPMEMSDSDEDSTGRHRRSLIIHCLPLTSAYAGGSIPEHKKFSLRHSLFCNYTYIDPSAVSLLGYLPQDLNGMQIFDLYHPDDLPMLLDVHKKIMLLMGQPFKSDKMRLRTRNGCYVEVETEWSSFINPWSMRLEFIIGQHTVVQAPSSPDLFEDIIARPDKFVLTPETRKIKEKILEILKKPIQNVFAEPSPVSLPPKDKAGASSKSSMTIVGDSKDSDAATKTGGASDKPKDEPLTTESKSAVIDEKGISSIYNQLNYSHNIKRFLMSHPKSFSNVSDEDCVMTRDDSEDEAINEEEELPLEIPVVKPPSCGSSTQVHVSEPGHAEDISSVPPFGDETSNLPRESAADSRHSLTEETLKKHTKMQERLYLQRISEEQPLLLNMRRVKKSRNTSHQKRPRPKETEEEADTAKHPCTNSGIFRSSSNIFMQNFPVIKEGELTPASAEPEQLFDQAKMENGNPINTNYLGQQGPQISFHSFPQGFQPGNQAGLGLPQQPAIHLVPGEPVPISCIPTSLTTMLPTQGLVDMGEATQRSNIQWPYYPQTGYTLMPQVMTGFYQPVLQPVQVSQGSFIPSPVVKEARVQSGPQAGEPKNSGRFDKKANYSDNNQSSSVEDTTSSIMYLLDADSSTFEDSDNKHSVPTQGHPRWMHNKRAMEPPWLRDINWNTDTKMRYQLPQAKMLAVLKMDENMIKKTQQNEEAQLNLQQLLEDVASPDFDNTFDEEADYIFFPGDEVLDESDLSEDKCEEVEMTQALSHFQDEVGDNGGQDDDGGGGGEGGGGGGGHDGGGQRKKERKDTGGVEKGRARENTANLEETAITDCSNSDEGQGTDVVWALGPCSEQEEENFNTPVNSHSEDEKAVVVPVAVPITITEQKEEKTTAMKMDAGVEDASSFNKVDQSGEENGDGGDVVMETMFCGAGPEAGSGGSPLTLVAKRGSSPKDGSLSGDECSASDGGQKIEMEDAQSSCSKESSDLTQSEVRSNEEAGSSLKESDSSLKLAKGGPSGSVASPSSSTDHMGQEDASNMRSSNTVANLEEVFQKLFVPLKVRYSHRMNPRGTDGTAAREKAGLDSASKRPHKATPYWLVEAHLSQRVAMTYKVSPRQLEDVLSEDRRRMTDLVQSPTVRNQLLQLLSEVDVKAGTSASSAKPSAEAPLASSSSMVSSPPADNHPIDVSTGDSITLLSVSPSVQSPTQADLRLYASADYACFTAKKVLRNSVENTDTSTHLSEEENKPFSPVSEKCSQNKSPSKSTSPTQSREENMSISLDSLPETRSMKFPSLRATSERMESMRSGLGGENSSPSPQHLYREAVFSDTNSDSLVDKPTQVDASRYSQTSSTDITNIGCDSGGDDGKDHSGTPTPTFCREFESGRGQSVSSVTNMSRIDSHLQEKLHALESTDVGEQSIEDIIMSKVFFSTESVQNSVGNRRTPDLRDNVNTIINILD
ncbi:cationic amino acid transporter [Plakobranchus ocellatus]|uniref:Cationic amino acid transporter n=1 Tax=Plakobranchus ocellatus TaxID=259542 RepID=A0AAV4BSL3_9GAST|nr:cationic amino acid transporter [Plakobranchus ocellatus]